MARGRKPNSIVRQHMVDILACLGSASGYDIYKVHRELFPKCTLRLMYYHLKKGVVLGEFIVDKIQKVEGTYSWGPLTEKKMYAIGPKAHPNPEKRVKEYITTLKKEEAHGQR
ncbi:MAG: hypothetical protein Q7R76_04325 [Candidatus Woesearchaeota archaeon]|nr:hypothetical protein [Candidatus Woesearchaeota archaeon]